MTTATRTLHPTPNWASSLARIGYLMNGIVHLMIGVLISFATLEHRRAANDLLDAHVVQDVNPFVDALMVLIALGMLAFGCWRFLEAALDPERGPERGAKRIAKRGGFIVSGAVYCALGIAALDLVFGGSVHADVPWEQGWTTEILDWQLGPAFIVGIGTAIILFALLEIYRAWVIDFTRTLRVTKMSTRERRFAMRVGRAGLFTRGLVLVVIGALIVQLGLHARIIARASIDDALRTAISHASGQVLLIAIAIGFVTYGIFQLVQARYRNFPTSVRSQSKRTDV
jgi:hypothetical protein